MLWLAIQSLLKAIERANNPYPARQLSVFRITG
jgi:hypothetical protein